VPQFEEKLRAHLAEQDKEWLIEQIVRLTLDAPGTWQDPKGTASDSRADYILMEIEYGEARGEHIGEGIISALKVINNLEVNEKVLYARMSEIEQARWSRGN
jgi:hypothetical protein